MLGDQPFNMAKAAKLGFALPPLDFNTLSVSELDHAIQTILTNSRYTVPHQLQQLCFITSKYCIIIGMCIYLYSFKENAQRLSNLFHDQPEKPLDRAIYWTEYVIRHKGAVHLRSAGRDLSLLAYFSVDVIALLVTVIIIWVGVSFLVLRTLCRKYCGGKNVTKGQGQRGSGSGSDSSAVNVKKSQ
jgi:hypothetical protein